MRLIRLYSGKGDRKLHVGTYQGDSHGGQNEPVAQAQVDDRLVVLPRQLSRDRNGNITGELELNRRLNHGS